METKIKADGEIIIPCSVRKKFGITKNTRIQILVDEAKGQIILTPITREFMHSLRGMYKGKGLLQSLMAEKKLEKAL